MILNVGFLLLLMLGLSGFAPSGGVNLVEVSQVSHNLEPPAVKANTDVISQLQKLAFSFVNANVDDEATTESEGQEEKGNENSAPKVEAPDEGHAHGTGSIFMGVPNDYPYACKCDPEEMEKYNNKELNKVSCAQQHKSAMADRVYCDVKGSAEVTLGCNFMRCVFVVVALTLQYLFFL
eukprot:GHVU01181246.1.p3 GENE.GHVU01181246.1~~GHVU01181246.1.p3  ORF type:complete len:179 (+),score=23.99 GHVU01181246.1:3496-4032(+)